MGAEFVEDCKALYETVLPRVLEGDTEDARGVYLYTAQRLMTYVAKVMFDFSGRWKNWLFSSPVVSHRSVVSKVIDFAE